MNWLDEIEARMSSTLLANQLGAEVKVDQSLFSDLEKLTKALRCAEEVLKDIITFPQTPLCPVKPLEEYQKDFAKQALAAIEKMGDGE